MYDLIRHLLPPLPLSVPPALAALLLPLRVRVCLSVCAGNFEIDLHSGRHHDRRCVGRFHDVGGRRERDYPHCVEREKTAIGGGCSAYTSMTVLYPARSRVEETEYRRGRGGAEYTHPCELPAPGRSLYFLRIRILSARGAGCVFSSILVV